MEPQAEDMVLWQLNEYGPSSIKLIRKTEGLILRSKILLTLTDASINIQL